MCLVQQAPPQNQLSPAQHQPLLIHTTHISIHVPNMKATRYNTEKKDQQKKAEKIIVEIKGLVFLTGGSTAFGRDSS